MLLFVPLALAGKAPAALSAPVWIDGGELAPRVCVSFFPDKRFKADEAAEWQAIRAAVETDELETAIAAASTLRRHPALRTLKAARYLAGRGVAIDLTRELERYPDDGCLRVMAAAMALKESDARGVKRHLDAALRLLPDNQDVAAMAVLMGGDDWRSRAEEAIAANPDDPRLRYTVAQLAETKGDLQLAVDNYAAVYASGNLSVGEKLSTLALRAGDPEAYLRVVAPTHPVQVEGVSDAADPGAAFFDWLGVAPGETLPIVIETSAADLHCVLDPSNAPMTVMNFVGLARGDISWTENGVPVDRPLYDGTVFHRVIPDFMIQGGDPEGTGRGSPGYRFADEPAPMAAFDRPGLLAMANSGKDTNGSQFFITEVPTPHLSGKHTIFGVCDADAVRQVRRIARVDTDSVGRPDEDVVLHRIRTTSPVDETVEAMSAAAEVLQIRAIRDGVAPTVEGLDAVFPDGKPRDGWGRALVYEVPGPAGRDFELISLGADGREGGSGEDADIRYSERL
jgi:peptidyl-prolyl cis-trans isomerase A (cyclophilin A)